MCKHFSAKWIALLGALVLPMVAKAADFPSQLWGRSVVVSWNTNGEDQPSAVSSNNPTSSPQLRANPERPLKTA